MSLEYCCSLFFYRPHALCVARPSVEALEAKNVEKVLFMSQNCVFSVIFFCTRTQHYSIVLMIFLLFALFVAVLVVVFDRKYNTQKIF